MLNKIITRKKNTFCIDKTKYTDGRRYRAVRIVFIQSLIQKPTFTLIGLKGHGIFPGKLGHGRY